MWRATMGRTRGLFFGLLSAALLFGCSGGDDDTDDKVPPPKVTRLLFDTTDICNAKVPMPTDLFLNEGKSELSSCPGPADPVEKALYLAQIDEGTPLNSEIVIPIDGSL